ELDPEHSLLRGRALRALLGREEQAPLDLIRRRRRPGHLGARMRPPVSCMRLARRSAPVVLLLPLLAAFAIALAPARAQDRPDGTGTATAKPASKARLAVASDPEDAVVLLFSLDEVKNARPDDTLGHGGPLQERTERVLGRTP